MHICVFINGSVNTSQDNIQGFVLKATMPKATEQQKRAAFSEIVRRFQDMAYGYAYSIVGSPQLAEEMAQEAFITAWRKLDQLQNPQAFPAWLRRIIFTQCQSLIRRKEVETVVMEPDFLLLDLPALDPQAALEQAEWRRAVHRAIEQLPEAERMVTILFYINDEARDDIAKFLGISSIAVKKRLASARQRLKKGMIEMLQNDLYEQRPSRSSGFQDQVLAFIKELGALLESGTPILKSLERCAQEQADYPRVQEAILDIRRTIRAGEPIGAALARYPELFKESVIEALSIGEEKGILEEVLLRLAAGE